MGSECCAAWHALSSVTMAPSDSPSPSEELSSGEPAPEHERLVGRLVADAHGESYDAFRSLDDAKKADQAAVVMQGDYGGSIYLTCPARLVLCDEATLRQLLFELDTLYWNDPDGAGLYYERVPVGVGIAGGTGGGIVTEGVWIHPDIEAQGRGVRQAVESVLFGRRASLSMKPRVVVEEITAESREIIVEGRALLREGPWLPSSTSSEATRAKRAIRRPASGSRCH